ncbi:hypothetical protein CY34DRAFT_801739 [Suillus luteus UH-Slu-Lm8-n1]|uniref:DUF6533 domain-containing protein n=1 Tax=Suillus luteus UH-Slu-Lm8-n1 TaxID=930992 RepID=A0A0D0BQK4_9AGAM|nr:hypothetical protein CY34DRAFT_801739 [Suillus luteus UH-Slu-Lm8-n1]
MTVVSNDPSWWPSINLYRISSYYTVAAYAVLMYDWVLTFGQEVELILQRQRWSLMTVLYLIVRCGGMFYAVGLVINDTLAWTSDIIKIILDVIMIARLHAMYQRSRNVLIFLVVTLLATRIVIAVMIAIIMTKISGEEFVLSGTYQCAISYVGDSLFLASMTWVLSTVWEVLVLCLAVWITVKHIRELRRRSTGSIIGDCFKVLMQTHVSYFASFVVVSCFRIGLSSQMLSAIGYPLGYQIYASLVQIIQVVQTFVLGPRLILSIREYTAELAASSDAATAMTSIAFQEQVSTSSTV